MIYALVSLCVILFFVCVVCVIWQFSNSTCGHTKDQREASVMRAYAMIQRGNSHMNSILSKEQIVKASALADEMIDAVAPHDLTHSKSSPILNNREVKNMASVFDVANWFLSQAPMTHKKLQKMCYYAQAWYCALYDGEPLFSNEIQAWAHGPVSPDLYQEYKAYGWELIPQKEFDNTMFDEQALEILDSVYETYGEFTGDQLERLTHSEIPWITSRGNCAPLETCTTPIPHSLMRTYYKDKYEQSQND